MKVLVTGSQGQVGQDFVDLLRGVLPPGASREWWPDGEPVTPGEFVVEAASHHDLDITDKSMVRERLSASRPDVVVNLAAYTAVDRAEDDSLTAFTVNEQGTAVLSSTAGEIDARFITVSTDYVFDGTKGTPYLETDPTHPLGVYGASKLAGEAACKPEDTIVRTSWVMGVRGKSVVHVMIDRARSGGHVNFVNDQTGTVTVASDLAKSLIALVRRHVPGILHVANTGTATWFDVANYVGELCGRGHDFANPITTDELSPAPRVTRPRFSALDTTKFSNVFSPLPDWHDGISRLVAARQEAS